MGNVSLIDTRLTGGHLGVLWKEYKTNSKYNDTNDNYVNISLWIL